jgi:hypothetical protein
LWISTISSWKRSAELHIGPLSEVTLARFGCGLLGGIILPIIASDQTPGEPLSRVIVVVATAAALLAGELLERYLFFAAAAAPRMPGAIRT